MASIVTIAVFVLALMCGLVLTFVPEVVGIHEVYRVLGTVVVVAAAFGLIVLIEPMGRKRRKN